VSEHRARTKFRKCAIDCLCTRRGRGPLILFKNVRDNDVTSPTVPDRNNNDYFPNVYLSNYYRAYSTRSPVGGSKGILRRKRDGRVLNWSPRYRRRIGASPRNDSLETGTNVENKMGVFETSSDGYDRAIFLGFALTAKLER